jgi:hypothetical protein
MCNGRWRKFKEEYFKGYIYNQITLPCYLYGEDGIKLKIMKLKYLLHFLPVLGTGA